MKYFLRIILSVIMTLTVLSASVLYIDAIDFSVEDIYESVFVIYSGNSLGSGFAIGEDCIVTNAHVISDPQNTTLKTYNGEQYTATVIGMDERLDIAVLGVNETTFTVLPLCKLDSVNIGDDIYAIGAPKSMDYTLTKGIISAKNRTVRGDSYIQIDAAINEGNSGGPLLNANGSVIGMNTLKMSDSEGIGLAIPIEHICEYLSTLNIPLTDSGNVNGRLSVTSPKNANSDVNIPAESEHTNNTTHANTTSALLIVVIIIMIISVIFNIILIILLVHQKNKNLTLKYNPSERTDFEIEILE